MKSVSNYAQNVCELIKMCEITDKFSLLAPYDMKKEALSSHSMALKLPCTIAIQVSENYEINDVALSSTKCCYPLTVYSKRSISLIIVKEELGIDLVIRN